jgi:integrase
MLIYIQMCTRCEPEAGMTQKLNFTKATLESIQPSNRRVYYSDTNPRSPKRFGLYVTKAGAKCFFISRTVDGETKRLTLGRFPDLTLENARKKADRLAGLVAEGVDPIKQKAVSRAKQVTLSEVFEEYLTQRNVKLAANTEANYRTIMRRHLSDWQGVPLAKISRAMVEERHRELGKISPTSANKSMRVLRAIFNFANGKYEDFDGRSLFPENPVNRLKTSKSWNKESRRTNVLVENDMRGWYEAVQAQATCKFGRSIADCLVFILLTGLRRREATNLRWADIDLKNRTFIVRSTKNGKPLHLPLSDFLLELLMQRKLQTESEWVFPGESDDAPIKEPKTRVAIIRSQCEVHFTVHDLRRTFITTAESLEIGTYALKALVNHDSRQSWDVTEGYVIMTPERLRQPMDKITTKIVSNLLGGEGGGELKNGNLPAQLAA